MKLDRALDLYMGDLARRGYSPMTRRSYAFKLNKLCDRHENVEDVTREDCAAFLDQWSDASMGTLGALGDDGEGVLPLGGGSGLDRALARGEAEAAAPSGAGGTGRGEHRRRRRAADARRVRELARGAAVLGVLCYLGPRRRAASQLRWRDVGSAPGDGEVPGEGAQKAITKPLPASWRRCCATRRRARTFPRGRTTTSSRCSASSCGRATATTG